MLQAVSEGHTLQDLSFHHDIELAVALLALNETDREPFAREKDEYYREEEAETVQCKLSWLLFHLFLDYGVFHEIWT